MLGGDGRYAVRSARRRRPPRLKSSHPHNPCQNRYVPPRMKAPPRSTREVSKFTYKVSNRGFSLLYTRSGPGGIIQVTLWHYIFLINITTITFTFIITSIIRYYLLSSLLLLISYHIYRLIHHLLSTSTFSRSRSETNRNAFVSDTIARAPFF